MDDAPFGDLLRQWRRRRGLSQLALAGEAGLSARHLSFLETGRASPSREMALRLAVQLDLPLGGRNALLEAAGYAPPYRRSRLDAPEMGAARRALDVLLRSHLPNPSLAFDRGYDLVAANEAVGVLLAGVDPALLQPPINVVRLSLHPGGLAARIDNLAQWRGHILGRLRRQLQLTADPALEALVGEVASYPFRSGEEPTLEPEHSGVLLPLRIRTGDGVLSFVSTVTVFGTPHDITLQELAVESFFPADEATARALAARSAAPPSPP